MPDRSRIILNWVILVSAVVALGVALVLYYRAVTASPAAKTGKGSGFQFTVRTAPVQRTTLTPSILLQGDVVSNETATIRAEISGVVTKVLAERGKRVKAGALLVQLDDRDRVLALRRQQASSMEAHAAQIRASTLVAKAKDLEQRLAKLEKHELVSEEALAQARIDLRTARAAVAQTQAQAALRYVEILTARRELDRARIRAPFSGRLSKRLVAVGDRVDVGTPLVELVGGAGLELHLYVPVSTVNRVKPEAPVRFRLAGRGARWHKGRLTRVLPVVDPLSRNQTAVVALPAPPPGFTPGLAVEARLVVGRIADALVVSSDALSRLGARWVVFKVQTGKARRVAVRILGEDDRKVAVSGGLAAGDPVVVVGNEALFPNAPVRVVNPPAVASQGAGGPRPAAANSR